MNYKPIIIVNGEPNSIFLEIFFKSISSKKIKSPILLISSLKLIKHFMKKLNFRKSINIIKYNDIDKKTLDNKSINLIEIKYNFKKPNQFIKKSFILRLNLLNEGLSNKFINGPISKKSFLKKKFPGITEYIATKMKIKKVAMLIYNKELSVCPLSTHVPIKNVHNEVTKKNIKEKIELIDEFYQKYRKIKPKIAVLGLNPHCESTDKFNEDERIIKPTIKNLSKLGYKIFGPYAADTIFLKKNRSKFDVILGMYHDQVLTPIKTLHEYDAINITLGLPFIRISPDHGPNKKMIGKNISNPLSLIRALEFLDKN